ncbi:hypothetical protein V1292_004842 [Bradyrhizobium sp. AZCC 1719]|uniref:hypothetical protein n=1 Tax=Bradyrhizobium sp. AZCC 1719 TaxID=3117028 RepID=UPI002FF1C9C3
MRKIKWNDRAFSSANAIQREQFASILKKSAGSTTPFNDKFFEVIDKRRGELGKLQQTLFFLQLPTFIYLVLILTGTDVNLNLFGITAGKNLREPFILVSSGLALWTSFIGHHRGVLENILRANNDRLSKGDAQKANFLNVSYGLEVFYWTVPNNPDWNISKWHIASAIFFVVATVVLVLLAFAGVAAVHFSTLLEIYRHPNFSPLATIITITFVALSDTVALSSFALQSGILPYRNYERLHKLDRLRTSNPKKYDDLITSMAKSHRDRSLLKKIFVRPTLPNL